MKIIIEIPDKDVQEHGIPTRLMLHFIDYELASVGGRYDPDDWRFDILRNAKVNKIIMGKNEISRKQAIDKCIQDIAWTSKMSFAEASKHFNEVISKKDRKKLINRAKRDLAC